jgi:hypothetical protein
MVSELLGFVQPIAWSQVTQEDLPLPLMPDLQRTMFRSRTGLTPAAINLLAAAASAGLVPASANYFGSITLADFLKLETEGRSSTSRSTMRSLSPPSSTPKSMARLLRDEGRFSARAVALSDQPANQFRALLVA